jgi:hypothetical protein
MTKLVPRKPVPSLEVSTLDGGVWRLSDRNPAKFTVETIAVSTDDESRARDTAAEWALDGLKIGYGLAIEKAREWGLYISSGRGKTSMGVEEPALFNEPGLFLMRPDGTLYWSIVQTMPFLRPHFAELVGVLDRIEQMDYPARGEA